MKFLNNIYLKVLPVLMLLIGLIGCTDDVLPQEDPSTTVGGETGDYALTLSMTLPVMKEMVKQLTHTRTTKIKSTSRISVSSSSMQERMRTIISCSRLFHPMILPLSRLQVKRTGR